MNDLKILYKYIEFHAISNLFALCLLGTTLNVPKVKASSAILLDDQVAGKDPEDLNLSSMVRRSTRRSQRSSAVVADLKIAELQGQQRPALRSSSSGSINGSATANSVSSASDDEGLDDVSRNGPGSNASISSTNSGSKSKSRIDKWKAKHEAMLKMAENNKNPEHDDEEVRIFIECFHVFTMLKHLDLRVLVDFQTSS